MVLYMAKKRILEMLGPPLSWNEIAKIVTDVSVPNLTLKGTTHDTLSQLVPESFPEMIREQLIAFLSFVVRDEIPDADPIEFNYSLLSMPMLGSLINGHIRCMVDGEKSPSYVKLMTLAARGQLGSPKRAVSDDLKDIPWMLFWQKCTELFPNWLSYSIQLVNELNETGRIPIGLPITKSVAQRSKSAWKKRFASLLYDLRMLGHIDAKSLGLTDLVYLGAAYRWPHRHMKFITRLGTISENTQHLQVMTMPLTVGKTSSERKLMQLSGKRKVAGLHSISKQEAKVLDLLATGINLEDLEIQDILDYLKLDSKLLRSTIKDLSQRNILDISYETTDDQLISLATIIQGKDELLRAITIAFLKNTPTSLAMLNDTQDQVILLSRFFFRDYQNQQHMI